MTLDFLLLAQIALGALLGGISGIEAGRYSNDERFWIPMLAVGTVASVGNALPDIPLNPVPLVLGLPGLIACVACAIAGMEFGLWTAGSRQTKVIRKR
jgi:hypothetical protein